MQREVVGTTRMRLPDDGIVASHRAHGWLGRHWLAMADTLGDRYPDRAARGRSWARSGRVRDLWFSPGLANAEVVDSQSRQVTVRVRVFDEPQWSAALELLRSNLRYIAALMEGELPTSLVEAFDAAGLQLLPEVSELDSNCSCDDFALPCAHVAAVHHVLADALDGEPFLLLTLRGRPREQIIAALRRAWGDTEGRRRGHHVPDEAPPEGDWYRAPAPLPGVSFSFQDGGGRAPSDSALGLLELGPPPGQADLERALRPLYDAGANAAVEIALREPPVPLERRRRRRVDAGQASDPSGPPATPEPEEDRTMATTSDNDAVADEVEDAPAPEASDAGTASEEATPAPPNPLTEKLVDYLARVECAKSKELATELGVTVPEIRNELVELEKMGIVYRTGQTRGTRWWLG